MITESRIYDVKKMSPEEMQSLGLRVLIMRQWPRGIAWSLVDVWIPDLGPSVTLLNAYNAGLVDWPTFETRYREEQDQATMCVARFREGGQKILSLSPMQVLRDLERQHRTVTVMCREPEGQHCHRHIVVQSAKENVMQHCESCKRPYSLVVDTYCVPVQTPYGMLCHQCQSANEQDLRVLGQPRHVSDAILRQRGEANSNQFAEMLKEVL